MIPSSQSIDTQAAEWFGRREVGLTAEQEREFQAWLSADPRHLEHYQEFDSTWDVLDRVREIPALVQPSSAKRITFPRFLYPVLATAAVIALGLFLFLPRSNQSLRYTASTDVTGFKKLELPDGSIVHLNANTSVTVDLTSSERRILLTQGEAFFNVAHDTTRPFLVTAANHTVRAVGTAFNVSLHSAQLDVLVTEGKVRVDDLAKGTSVLPQLANSSEPPVLSAGERVTVNLTPISTSTTAAIVPVAAPELQQAISWQVRMLDFDNQPLSDVVEQFNRHNQHQLVIVDPSLGQKIFGGSFRADNYSDLVDLLESRYDVIAKRDGDRTFLRLRH